MDKRVGIWASLTVIGFLIVTKTQLLNILFAFLILGMIPGTRLAVPAWVIGITYPIGFIAVLAWIGRHSLFMGIPTPPPDVLKVKKQTKKRLTAKQKLAAKRHARLAA